MAHRRPLYRRVFPELNGLMLTFLPSVVVMLLLYSQPAAAEDTHSLTAVNECDNCSDTYCIQVGKCKIKCDGCEAHMYKYKSLDSSYCNQPSESKQVPMKDTGVTATAVTTTSTLPTTTSVPVWLCKSCTLPGCKTCRDLAVPPACELCLGGYQLNNDSHTCFTETADSSSSLSGVAVAGIVIAVLCIIGLAVVAVLFVLRKFHGSRDVSGHTEKIQPISSAGSKVSSNVPQIPKISTQDLLRKHDQITRYMKDPTSKDSPKNKRKYLRSPSHEKKELDELGDAPEPPAAESNTYTDMMSKYDHPGAKDETDPSLYLPIQNEQDDLYLNTAAVENEFKRADGHYENTQQTNHHIVNMENSANGTTTKHPAITKSQDSIDTYEPIGTASPVDESQQIYANDDSTVLVANIKDGTEEIYMNEEQENADDIYQNT